MGSSIRLEWMRGDQEINKSFRAAAAREIWEQRLETHPAPYTTQYDRHSEEDCKFGAAAVPRRIDESVDNSERVHVVCLTRLRAGAFVRASGAASGCAVAVLGFFRFAVAAREFSEFTSD
jgi:hypothetical protein